MTSGPSTLAYTRQQATLYTSFYYETSATPPTCYGVSAGNSDGMGMSWGIIQFNLGSGTLQPIWRDLINQHPDVCAAAITNTTDYNTWTNMVLNQTLAEQKAWGASITDPNNGHLIIDPWKTYFATLGLTPESIARQDQANLNNYQTLTETWVDTFGVWSRRAYSLLYDISVQYGGILSATQTTILNDFATMPGGWTDEQKELFRMRTIANRCADDHPGTYQATSRARKLAIANGSGYVYGPTDTVPYDLILEPISTAYVPDSKRPHFVRIHHNMKGQ